MMPASPAPDDRGRQQMRISPGQASALRHVSSAESREFQAEGFTAMPTSPDATSGPVTRCGYPVRHTSSLARVEVRRPLSVNLCSSVVVSKIRQMSIHIGFVDSQRKLFWRALPGRS